MGIEVLQEVDRIPHHYMVCKVCGRRCKEYCLPVEMIVLLIEEPNHCMKLQMIENISRLFKDDV